MSRLLRSANAQRIDAGDPLTFAYRFGDGLYVVWGADRPIRWSSGSRAWDASGAAALAARAPDRSPVIVETTGSFTLGAAAVLDDSLLDFAGASWRYAADAAGSPPAPLDWVDWNWSPYLGTQRFPNFRAMPNVVSLGGRPGASTALIERYADSRASARWVSACFETPAAKPADVTILAGGKTLFAAHVAGPVQTQALAVPQGQAVEIRYAGSGNGQQLVRRRIRILARAEPGARALCAPEQRPGRHALARRAGWRRQRRGTTLRAST